MPHCCEQKHQSHKKYIPDKHAGHSAGGFLKKFWLSLILTILVVIYSDLPKILFGWQAPTFGIWNLEFH